MKRLLSIELQKIWKSRSSRILTITYFVLLTSLALITTINFNFIGIDIRPAEIGIFNFPYIWHFNTYVAAVLKIFLAIVIVSMISNEYSYGTLKQNLIDGMTKKEFIISKFLTVLLFAVISTIYIFIVTLLLGYSYSSYDEPSIVFSEMDYLAAYLIKLTAFFSFCLFLGVLIKRSAFAIGFFVVWAIAEQIIINAFSIPKSVTLFLPLESMSNLIRQPFTRLEAYQQLEKLNGTAIVRDYGVHLSTMLIAIAWIVIFVLLSYKLLQKRDL
ncbi:ABC transporter permease [Flavobacterium pallidum]|uniref:ABC transporter permease n=1 Tax=Flavobacterium pallidum TaxID=2172098 RepID=A0A2S1SI98_9FLAO|nr:ABC transporter permease subunit [Flavobacterium pallidum]AWI26067.1 ABC transporter permease [Flavobacterium pallidum]